MNEILRHGNFKVTFDKVPPEEFDFPEDAIDSTQHHVQVFINDELVWKDIVFMDRYVVTEYKASDDYDIDNPTGEAHDIFIAIYDKDSNMEECVITLDLINEELKLM
jgi:hypothetical protein